MGLPACALRAPWQQGFLHGYCVPGPGEEREFQMKGKLGTGQNQRGLQGMFCF